MQFSWLDVILVVIMLISGVLAMVRGFTREVLSIFSWAVAAVAALYLKDYSTSVETYFPSPAIAQVAFAAGVFILTLIVVSFITFRISDRVLDSRVGALDRTFGFIFGLARGFLLVAIVFILFSTLASVQPAWITEARSYPILQQTQVAITSMMPADPNKYLPGGKKDEAGAASGTQGAAPAAPAPAAQPPAEPAPAPAAPAPAPADPAPAPVEPAPAPAEPAPAAPAAPGETPPANPPI
jgi:membrane protein required for colicin V production